MKQNEQSSLFKEVASLEPLVKLVNQLHTEQEVKT